MNPGSQEKHHQLTKLWHKVHADILVKLHTQQLVFLLTEQLYGAPQTTWQIAAIPGFLLSSQQ